MTLELITEINTVIVLLFCGLSAYQYLYIIVSVLFSPCRYTTKTKNRYAILVCARNEASVISHLIDSIKKQDYPEDCIDIFVMADNCTDETAEVAETAGARVFVRKNTKQVGKGYALDALYHAVCDEKGTEYYNGYFVFDADNLLTPNYITEMNRVFSNGYRVVTSYRNSKNFLQNWITAGYGIFFLREARHMNNARMICRSSCAISGTGFLVHRDILKEKGGWPYHLLTEDIEFTMDHVAAGEKIGYCHDAVFYDEQPTTFCQSWNQRLRWSRGALQVMFKYGFRVFLGIFRRKSFFSCFDIIMSTLPNFITSVFGLVSIASMVFIACSQDVFRFGYFLAAFGSYLLGMYGVHFIMGLITAITEWRRISGHAAKKILFIFTYPIFMITNIPISIAALFVPVKWKEIKHTNAVGIGDMDVTQKP